MSAFAGSDHAGVAELPVAHSSQTTRVSSRNDQVVAAGTSPNLDKLGSEQEKTHSHLAPFNATTTISAAEKAKGEIDDALASPPEKAKKGFAFWMIMLSLAMSMFLSALDLTAVTTALPTIAEDLRSDNFAWIGSAYTLSSTAFLPVFGGLAQSFGRKYNMLASIVLFAVGSAVCGSANSMSAMLAGRTIQGIGGGGILALSEIVVADLVPLAERGLFMGLLGLVWALASAVGPVTGGAIAEANWRWIFYLNLPIAGLAFGLVSIFMTLKIPSGRTVDKLRAFDWIGSALFVISATLIILGLTFGGDQFPWTSAGTLAPLIIGLVILAGFVWVEYRYVDNGILPFELFNRTTLMGYLATFFHGLAVMAIVYFLPAWFMAVKGHSAVQAGISLFPVSFLIAPFAIAAGVSVTITQKYFWQNIAGWVLVTAGAGVLSLPTPSTSSAVASATQVPVSIGLGLLYAATTFPVLSPLPPSLSAHAMSFHAFTRSFGQVIGITVGTVVLSNKLAADLPTEFLASLPAGAASAYSSIKLIADIPEPLRTAVRTAFSDAIQTIWYVLIGIGALGLACSCFMKSLPLNSTTDEAWGIQQREKGKHAVAALEP